MQKIVDRHLERQRSLQDRVALLLEGLQSLHETAHLEGKRFQPPEPLGEKSEPFQWILPASNAWLATHYLQDFFVLQGIYVEQLRQFSILVNVAGGVGSTEEKAAEAKRRIEERPNSLGESIAQLASRLPSGFPRLEELQSLQRLHQAFAAATAGQSLSPEQAQPVVLCRPEPSGSSGSAGNFTVQHVQIRIEAPSRLCLTRELLYQIYFTGFIVCRDVAEAVKAMATSVASSTVQ